MFCRGGHKNQQKTITSHQIINKTVYLSTGYKEDTIADNLGGRLKAKSEIII